MHTLFNTHRCHEDPVATRIVAGSRRSATAQIRVCPFEPDPGPPRLLLRPARQRNRRSASIADVRCEVSRPHLRIRRGASKGGRSRIVPLWWDAGTLADITRWKAARIAAGASATDPFVASLWPGRLQVALAPHASPPLQDGVQGAGLERLHTLTIHHGRHTFISHALAGHRTLAEVRDAAGHANVSITSAYLHVAVDDEGVVGSLFGQHWT